MVRISPDGEKLAGVSNSVVLMAEGKRNLVSIVSIWTTTTGKFLEQIAIPENSILDLRFAKDGKELVVAGRGAGMYRVDIGGGDSDLIDRCETNHIRTCADATHYAFVNKKGRLRIRSVLDPSVAYELQISARPRFWLSRDATKVLVSDVTGCHLWNRPTEGIERRLDGIAISGDAALIAKLHTCSGLI
jgi:hypothetical protein